MLTKSFEYMFLQAIRRINPDGSQWRPKPYTIICGDHFVTGEASKEHGHPDYVPSKFTAEQRTKPRTEEDLARYQRVCNKNLLKRLKGEKQKILEFN